MGFASVNTWLARYAVLTAATTLALISLGGLVTSHGAGLAVPDWPTTYGENMFFFPVSKWSGGVFYEHTHRLLASAVGFMTVVLAIWLWLKEDRRWMRHLGIVAVLAVIAQGVLGGLRVTALKDELGIFHAALAQGFFVLLCAIALFSTRWWRQAAPSSASRVGTLIPWLVGAVSLIVLQLVLGATMRHQHAGLSIPDFPAAYGQWWPKTDPDSIARYNAIRVEANAVNEITAGQVWLQMAHRLVAAIIFLTVLGLAIRTRNLCGSRSTFARLVWGWFGVVLLQAILGATTIWTGKSPDVATAHVALGALTLVSGVLLILGATRSVARVPASAGVRDMRVRAESSWGVSA